LNHQHSISHDDRDDDNKVTPAYSVSFYLPTIIVQAGFDDPVTANLLASPVWLLAACIIILNAWLSDRYARRHLNVIIPGATGCVGFALLGWGNALDNFGMQYAAMYLACGSVVCIIPVALAWMNDLLRGSTRTSVAHAMAVGPHAPAPPQPACVCVGGWVGGCVGVCVCVGGWVGGWVGE
jgi:MFS family permease